MVKPDYIGHRKRIKERFLTSGLVAYKDYEVLELLLSFAINQKDVKPIAKDLIARFKTFQGVLDASFADLKKTKGLGEHSAVLLKLTRACSDYYLKGKIIKKDVIGSPEDLLTYYRSSMAPLTNEQFRVVHLNSKNEVIKDEILQEGTVDQTAVYPRKIMEHALKEKSVALIFVHNHPSGNPTPSDHDRHLTSSLVKAAETLSITVHDHIIIGKNSYYSFRQSGLL